MFIYFHSFIYFVVLQFENKTSCFVDKYSTIQLHLWPFNLLSCPLKVFYSPDRPWICSLSDLASPNWLIFPLKHVFGPLKLEVLRKISKKSHWSAPKEGDKGNKLSLLFFSFPPKPSLSIHLSVYPDVFFLGLCLLPWETLEQGNFSPGLAGF